MSIYLYIYVCVCVCVCAIEIYIYICESVHVCMYVRVHKHACVTNYAHAHVRHECTHVVWIVTYALYLLSGKGCYLSTGMQGYHRTERGREPVSNNLQSVRVNTQLVFNSPSCHPETILLVISTLLNIYMTSGTSLVLH